ncbi:hypothetical protein A6J40_18175 [Legionella longbeachae]|uniref:Uncharacterized protein n=1 Tax=Legionella longbeachae serogroup 1 (strain NSW150) TaxID=661367 RepID=D3HJH8_LEGLN|nr:hypothetical protein A6J40_18175 [Legionella longbeachae]EEZ94321.1 hypothetical protein LLB_3226 [Legionella longbeachae D-4968]CBJ12571.1 protein of unknown function [Legionella longbeachae NSW150]ARM32870.1 hypothetical protein B0B39_04775 [Legionella longbeachae]QEY52033.1 hypothetical protein FQU71_12795 [Legionella longbeachae]
MQVFICLLLIWALLTMHKLLFGTWKIAMSIWKKFKEFYTASAENRIGFYTFLGFLVIPILGMTILYILVRIFWIRA